MNQPEQRSIVYVGNDPSLEYLLSRYAERSGCRIHSLRGQSSEPDLAGLRPLSIWFSSVDALAAAPPLRLAAASLDIPLVLCAAVSGDARAVELGVDYVFLHPVTYDHFVSTLGGGPAGTPLGEDQAQKGSAM